MKLKIKYTSTKKFVLNFNGSTLGELTAAVRTFVTETYGDECPHLVLSLNGRSPLEGSADSTLQQMGLVPADLLTVINDQEAAAALSAGSNSSAPAAASHTNSASDTGGGGGGSSSTPAGGNSSTSGSAAAVEHSASPAIPPTTLLEVTAGSALPPSLHQLLQLCQPASPSQMVALLAHLTMLECGFRVQDSTTTTSSCSAAAATPSSSQASAAPVVAAPPMGWDQHLATLSYAHASYRNFTCTLVMITVASVKQLIVSFPDQDVEISTKVNAEDFVRVAAAGAPMDASSLINISRLAQRLRNELLVPLQLAAHRQLGLPSPFHLAGLPSELVERVLRLLDVRSALRLAQTCIRLQQLTSSNQALWRYYCERDLAQFQKQEHADYRQQYKTLYLEEKSSRLQHDLFWDQHREDHRGTDPIPAPGFPLPNMPFPPRVPDPSFPSVSPFADPDSPYYGGEVPNGPHLPQNPPSLYLPPRRGSPSLYQDPLNPFGDPMFGGLGPGLPGPRPGMYPDPYGGNPNPFGGDPMQMFPRRRGGPRGGAGRGGGAGGFQFI